MADISNASNKRKHTVINMTFLVWERQYYWCPIGRRLADTGSMHGSGQFLKKVSIYVRYIKHLDNFSIAEVRHRGALVEDLLCWRQLARAQPVPQFSRRKS